MSIAHFAILRKKLESNKWSILEELPGDGYSVSAIWRISRAYDGLEFNLVFEGLDTLTLDKING